MSFGRSRSIHGLCCFVRLRNQYAFGSLRSFSNATINGTQSGPPNNLSSLFKTQKNFLMHDGAKITCSTMEMDLAIYKSKTRSMSSQVKAAPQVKQMGAMQVSMLSPGFVYEPYELREKIPFWKRWFTRSGWARTKEELMLELKSAYAISKLRKSGYNKQKFYIEALDLYKEINIHVANGDKMALRKFVTEKMFSALKNEIKQRQTVWDKVHWEMIEPVVKIRTLRARLIGVDRNDLDKVFIQLTLEFLTKQKFEAYNSKGAVVAGDKSKEVLVKDIWVFEKSLFHKGAYWRLCGRISL